MLFGPEDIKSLTSGDVTFDQLLNDKYRELVMRKKVVYR